MTVRKLSVPASEFLLLVMVQVCLAIGQRNEHFENIWSLFGQKAETELAALPEKGRVAFQKALIACSLYADEYTNARYKSECERASKFFLIEFSDSSSGISLLFGAAIALTNAHDTQTQLDFQQGRRDRADDNLRKVYIEILQKIYRDTKK